MENETGGGGSFVVSLEEARAVLLVSRRSSSLRSTEYEHFPPVPAAWEVTGLEWSAWLISYEMFAALFRISEISMEVAEGGAVSGTTPQAHLIERCDCPLGYSGLSCEVQYEPGFQ